METVILTNKVAVALAKIYKRGFKVDVDTLQKVKLSLRKKRLTLRTG